MFTGVLGDHGDFDPSPFVDFFLTSPVGSNTVTDTKREDVRINYNRLL